jgi:hypothetical protein
MTLSDTFYRQLGHGPLIVIATCAPPHGAEIILVLLHITWRLYRSFLSFVHEKVGHGWRILSTVALTTWKLCIRLD